MSLPRNFLDSAFAGSLKPGGPATYNETNGKMGLGSLGTWIRYALASSACALLALVSMFPAWTVEFSDTPTFPQHYIDPMLSGALGLLGLLMGIMFLVWQGATFHSEGRFHWWLNRSLVAVPVYFAVGFVINFTAFVLLLDSLPPWWAVAALSTLVFPLALFSAYLFIERRRKSYPAASLTCVLLAVGGLVLAMMPGSFIQITNEVEEMLWKEVALGHAKHVRTLIKLGANLNRISLVGFVDETPLTEAISKGQTEIAKELISAGADVNRGGDLTPLITAAQKGDTEVVKLLIKAGADVNLAAPNGSTALTSATKLEIIEILKEAGARGNSNRP